MAVFLDRRCVTSATYARLARELEPVWRRDLTEYVLRAVRRGSAPKRFVPEFRPEP